MGLNASVVATDLYFGEDFFLVQFDLMKSTTCIKIQHTWYMAPLPFIRALQIINNLLVDWIQPNTVASPQKTVQSPQHIDAFKQHVVKEGSMESDRAIEHYPQLPGLLDFVTP